MALTFPPGPSGGQVYTGPNGVDYTYNSTLGVWTATAAPAATTTYGLGLEITGSIVKVSIPVASAPPAAGTLATEAVDGSLYWDDNLTQLFIRYNNSGSPVWVAAAPAATGGGGGGPAAATLAEAATGTSTAVYNSPATSVPKTPADMTGAALIPGGNNGARPSPVTGMLRYNDTTAPAVMEYHNGTAWTTLATGGGGVGSVMAAGRLNPNGMGFIFGFNVASFAGVIGTGAYQINFTTPVTGTYIVVANSGTDYSAITSYSNGPNSFIVRSGVPPSADQSGIQFNFVVVKVA